MAPTKKQKRRSRDIEVEEAELEQTCSKLPEQYTLQDGDKYIPYDPTSSEYASIDMNSYFVTMGDEPEEGATDDGEVVEFDIDVTTWFNASAETNKVFRYKGKRGDGTKIWEEDSSLPKYVLCLEGDLTGTLLGEIKNVAREKKAEIEQVARTRIAEMATTATFAEVLDEVGGDEEEESNEEDVEESDEEDEEA